MKFSSLLVPVACCTCAVADQTVGQTDVYYDSGRNVVYAVASTNADYNSQYWYEPWTYTALFNGGQSYNWDSEPASTYVETPAQAGYEVVAETTHTLSVTYQEYQVDTSCTADCYDWADVSGYQLIDNGGDPDWGPTWTVWVWAAPIVYTTVVNQIVVDQQSGGRYRPAGPPATFDLRLRSFIPPLYVVGPEPYCFPFTNKSVLYNGNNRSFDPWSAEYKGHQSVTLVPAGPLALIPVNDVGATERFASDAVYQGPYGQTLKWDSVLHDCFLLDDYGQTDNSLMRQQYFNPGQNQQSVQFSGSITNPLTPDWATPSIDWNVSVRIDNSNAAAPTYGIVGQHDCFPAWEAYIGNQLINSYTPSDYSTATIAGCLSATWPYSPITVNQSGQIQP